MGQKEIYYWRKKHIWLYPGPSVTTVWISELCGNDRLPAPSPATFQQPRGSRPGLTSGATPWHSVPFGRLTYLDFRKLRLIQATHKSFQIFSPCAAPEGKVAFRLCCRGIQFYWCTHLPHFCTGTLTNGFSARVVVLWKPDARMDI